MGRERRNDAGGYRGSRRGAPLSAGHARATRFAASARELVFVAAQIVHRRVVETAADSGERGARDVDLGALGRFIRSARTADRAVDDVHARLPRDDADAARADVRIADEEVTTLLGDDGIARELDRLAID